MIPDVSKNLFPSKRRVPIATDPMSYPEKTYFLVIWYCNIHWIIPILFKCISSHLDPTNEMTTTGDKHFGRDCCELFKSNTALVSIRIFYILLRM